ncbi:AraC family transcriptional regulator [Actinoplanes lobatus]|uniref:AraC family transcriptional regulator n=1 Tax=Actinoplanes lobatus TaxID=113568 RepID=A0A7W7H8V9_9ACTN|nr:helix-turn-helix domain-containing protein [Actinoplanes lobatus]MBB4746051.1 AraC-like DNA-binding protein [Actinoplanes lobatus]GGN83558.1 AraC family transcriptional regulator [Actinoplanes lobatus]GIE42387.1 AraC family transcriptional regulator [Actinoplanes lobatus]
MDEYAWSYPVPGLRPWIGHYTGYRQRGVAPALHRGLPSPYLTLIFTLDDPLVVAAHPDPCQAPGRYRSLAGGLHLAPALITHDGRQSGVQVALRPLGCRALLGLPAAELANLDVDAAAVLGDRFVAETRDRLRSAPDWPARFGVLDAMLGGLARADDGPPRVGYAVRRLLGGGPVSVAGLAGEVGWSPRYLTDRIHAELGIRPKEAARVARFDRARRAIRPGVRLADVAATHGYADQSHLVRDFRAFAGCAPSRWLADEFGFVQALPPPDADDGVHD